MIKYLPNWYSIRRALIWIVEIAGWYTVLWFIYHMIRHDSIFPYPHFSLGMISYVKNALPTLVMALCDFVIIFHLLDRPFFTRRFLFKSIADCVISLGMMSVFVWIFVWANQFFNIHIEVDHAGVFMYNILIVLGLEVYYYIRYSHMALEKTEQAKREVLQYQLEALKAQVNPHFLFNSLNILLAIIPKNGRRASEFTLNLSRIYRYVLSMQNRSTVTLSEEMEFLESYIRILEIRYDHSFFVEITGRELIGNQHVIPFTMQLLLENIIKHNRISKQYPMHIRIEIGPQGVAVVNSLRCYRKSDTSSGIGLTYISRQYGVFGRQFTTTDDGCHFTAKVPYL